MRPGAVPWPDHVSLCVRGAGQPEPGGVCRGGAAGRGTEFGQHGGDLMVDGPAGEEQLGAISALLCPAQIRSSTSRSRRVSPNGSARVAVRGPAGIDRMPSRRILRRVSWAAAEAPRPVKIVSACRSAASSPASCRASAAS